MRIRCDGEKRRKEVLETACTVFGEKGYHKATFAEMGRCGKFHPSLISFHFRSKDDLYCAVWKKLEEEVQTCWPIDGGLAPDAPAKERLWAHVHASLGRHSDKQMRNFGQIHTQERVNSTGLLDKEIRKLEKTYREHMCGLIADLLGEGANDTDIQFCEMCVINQFSILSPPKPFASRTTGKQRKSAKFTMTDIDLLTDNIVRFSLGGIETIRQGIANREMQL